MIIAATILATGIVLGAKLLASALDDLRRLLANLHIVVNHVHEARKEGGAS